MATASPVPQKPAKRAELTKVAGLPGRRFDHVFFSTMALLLLATVFVGFARTYYLAGVFRAPLPSLTIHIHGALFSCWILLFLAQVSLVAAGRVRVHRTLGIAGFVLAGLMVVAGILAATDTLVAKRTPAGVDPRIFYIVPVTDMLIFAVLAGSALYFRKNPSAHKRLILIATSGLMIAAIARFPIAYVRHNPMHADFGVYLFLGVLAAYDFWSLRKLHRATLWGSLFLIFVSEIRFPIAKTAAWLSIADWVRSIAQ